MFKINLTPLIASFPLHDCVHTSMNVINLNILAQEKRKKNTYSFQVDDDKPMGFSHVFALRSEAGSFFIMHEIFRLSIHDF